MVPTLRNPQLHTHTQMKANTHSLVSQRTSKVLLDVGVHYRPEVEVLIVPEQVDDEDLKTGSDSNKRKRLDRSQMIKH